MLLERDILLSNLTRNFYLGFLYLGLMIDEKNDIKVGTPYLENVEVVGEFIEEIKDKKINILRFRRRKHSMRRQGHRQRFTKIKINEIKQG